VGLQGALLQVWCFLLLLLLLYFQSSKLGQRVFLRVSCFLLLLGHRKRNLQQVWRRA
jgi:hypothetical protein